MLRLKASRRIRASILFGLSCLYCGNVMALSLGDITKPLEKLGNEVWDETKQVFKHPKKQFKKGAKFIKQTSYEVVKESDKFFNKSIESSRKRLAEVGIHIKQDDKIWLYGSALLNPNTVPKIGITLVDDDFSVYEEEVQQRTDVYVFDFKNLLVNPVFVQVNDAFKKEVVPDTVFAYKHNSSEANIKIFIQRRPSFCGYDETDPGKECWEPYFDETISLPKASALKLNRYSEIELLFSQ